MEIIIEIVGELISGLFELLYESKRIPRAVRAAIVSVVFLPIAGLFIALAVTNRDSIAFVVLCAAVALLTLFAEIKVIRNIFKK